MSEQSVRAAEQTPSLSIVALDDDADFREYLRGVLEGEGHTIRLAGEPERCYALCEESLPDVVLLDMKMGRDNGESVLEELRVRWPKLCVIVVTGYPSLESMRTTFKRDVYDYLAKPFAVADLRATLASAARELHLGASAQDRLRGELGRRIRLARTERGWTLKDLSERSGISVSQLSSIERGSHLPSIESLLLVSNALDQKPSKWFEDAGF